MQTITITINNNTVLKTLQSLEDKHFIKIIDREHIDSPALPGKKLGISEFKKWINDAESSPTVSLEVAKKIWAGKRKQLVSLTK